MFGMHCRDHLIKPTVTIEFSAVCLSKLVIALPKTVLESLHALMHRALCGQVVQYFKTACVLWLAVKVGESSSVQEVGAPCSATPPPPACVFARLEYQCMLALEQAWSGTQISLVLLFDLAHLTCPNR